MIIGGLLKTSLIDFPDTISAVVYTCGCNLRCPFCHNPDLVEPSRYRAPIAEADFFTFLDRRKDQLEGITVTGGEPLIHPDALDFLRRIKSYGYRIKLDTNGCFPDALRRVLDAGIVDYLAMDIKAPFEKYGLLTGVMCDTAAISESIAMIKSSSCLYEFRTTVPKDLLTTEDIGAIIRMVTPARRYVVQRFRCDGELLDAHTAAMIFKDPEFEAFKKAVAPFAAGATVYFR
jgi:pyruvate formate lyase activating enzyme